MGVVVGAAGHQGVAGERPSARGHQQQVLVPARTVRIEDADGEAEDVGLRLGQAEAP
jgi:hypothetical protein